MKKGLVTTLIVLAFALLAVGVVLLVISIANMAGNTLPLSISLGCILLANVLNLIIKRINQKKGL